MELSTKSLIQFVKTIIHFVIPVAKTYAPLSIWHDFMVNAHKNIPVSDFVNPGVEIPPEPVIIQDETAEIEKEMLRLEAERKAKEKELLEKEKKDDREERKSKRELERERKKRERELEKEREKREKELKRQREREKNKDKDDEDKPKKKKNNLFKLPVIFSSLLL